MARTKQSEAKQVARDANRKAQQEVAWRRKESGLELVKLYLDTDTVMAIEEIAQGLGYKDPKPGTKKRLETLSECVTYCVHQLDVNQTGAKPETLLALEYRRLYQIARYRKDDKGDSLKEIADFLTKSRLPRAEDIFACHRKSEDPYEIDVRQWDEDDVDCLLDEGFLKEYLETMNRK